jgi:hypothetical protein
MRPYLILEWFNAQVAVAAGTSLADKFAPPIGSRSVGRAKKGRSKDAGRSLQGILDRLDPETRWRVIFDWHIRNFEA